MNEEKKNQEKSKNFSWQNHPDLANVNPSKLAMLNALAEQGSQKSPQDLLPFLMSVQGKTGGMKFSPQEMETIIQVLKIGKSAEEIARMDKIIQMMKLLR